MAETKDVGRFFFHTIRINKGTPPLHTAKTVMVEPPYYRSLSLIVRLPFRFGLVLGWWRHTGWDEEHALLEAVSGWGLDPYADDLDDPDTRQTIRENIAASGLDLDDEWQIISALGVAR